MGTTPYPAGTNVSETINAKEYGRSLLADAAGADAMGLVATTPAANTLLGRLKAISDNTDGIEGFLDGVEGLITATNAALATLNGYNDTVEALLTSGNTLAALIASADDAFPIAPGAGALAQVPKSLFVVATGTLSVGGISNTPISLGTVQAGAIIPFRARYVYSAGTSATVVGLI